MRIAPIFLLALAAASGAVAQEPTDSTRLDYEKIERLATQDRTESEKESGEDVRGREAWFNLLRSYPYGFIPAGARQAALRETQRLQERLARSLHADGRSFAAASQWQPIGPTNQGGRVRALACDPSNTDVFYAGAAAGGVWKTTNAGTSWTPTFDRESAISVCALDVDPSNPNVVWAGTGENFPSDATLLTATPAYLGDGVFRSTDAGMTWKQMGLTSAGAVSKIAVHRQNPSIIYAAVAKADAGFYRSTDAGATWTRTLSGTIYDLSVDPLNSDRVFIGLSSSVARSTDGGKTFTTITSGMTTSAGVRISVAMAPGTDRVYALVARGSTNGQIAEVYRSDDAGGTWRLSASFGGGFFNDQGVYDNCLAVSPDDPDVVLAGGIDVYRSADGGAHWTNSTRSYSGGNVHPDQHVLLFHPAVSSVVILGCDGGIYLSADQAGTWDKISDGMAITQFYRMDVDQSRPFRVYGGTQDNGSSGSFGTTGFVDRWTSVLGGDGFFVAADPGDPNWFYAEIYYGTLYRINSNNIGQRSQIDGGIPSGGSTGDPGNWATPIAMSPVDGKSLYSGRTYLWRTTNAGLNWTKLQPGTFSKETAIGLSPVDVNRIVIGTATGEVRYSTDYGATWGRPTGLPQAAVIDIRFDPVRAERVYLAYSGFGGRHIFRSDNSGGDFTDITSNLPNIPCNAIEVDPQNTDHLFVATDIGVFFSPDGGGLWVPFSEGLALAPTSDLRIHRASHTLIASTHGRSMFRNALDNLEVAPAMIYPAGGERIATPGTLEVRWYGFEAPSNIYIQYASGEPFQLIASGVTGGRTVVTLPARVSSSAVIRVEEQGTGRIVSSGPFVLTAPANVALLGRRNIVAEAIEIRRNQVWATARGSDTMMRLRLPLLSPDSAVVRTGFAGIVRDLAYDSLADVFYVLTTDSSFTSPHLYRMDTTGRAVAELPVPAGVTGAVGMARQDTTLALYALSPVEELVRIEPATGAVISTVPVAPLPGQRRRGLVWNGRTFVQGVSNDSSTTQFASELQQLRTSDPVTLYERVPVITTTGGGIEFVGLTILPGTSAGQEVYLATDTSGAFYRFSLGVLSSAPEMATAPTSAMTVGAVRPNPTAGAASLRVELAAASEVTVRVVTSDGREVMREDPRLLSAGVGVLSIDLSRLPAAVYFVMVANDRGERVSRPVALVR